MDKVFKIEQFAKKQPLFTLYQGVYAAKAYFYTLKSDFNLT
jgi:hypothetical protein